MRAWRNVSLTKLTLRKQQKRRRGAFFVGRNVTDCASQISIFVPSSTTRFAGMLKKSVGFAAF